MNSSDCNSKEIRLCMETILGPSQTRSGWKFSTLKVHTNGTKDWSIQVGTITLNIAYGYAVVVDSARNVYVSGQLAGRFATTTSVGGWDAFLMKFDKDGVQQWALQMGTTSVDGSFGLSIDANDNVYPLIKTEGSMEGSNLGLADIVLMQVDSTGTILSTDQFGTAGTEYLPTSGGAVAVDSAGDVFITGATNGAFTNYNNSGSYDLFVYKIDAKTTTTSSSSRTFTTSSSVTTTATTSSTATLSTTSTVSSSSTGSRTSTSTYSRNLAAVVNREWKSVLLR